MRAHFQREGTIDGPWTSYNASLGRPLLNTEKFLNPNKSASPEPASGEADTQVQPPPSSDQPQDSREEFGEKKFDLAGPRS